MRYVPGFSLLPCETRTLCCHLEHAKKGKAEATATALRQLAAAGRSWGVNRRRLRHRGLCRPQEGEQRAVVESAREVGPWKVQWDMDRRKAWGCGKGAQPEKQVHRSFAGVAAGTGRGQRPLEDQHCRERRSGIAHSPRLGRPVPPLRGGLPASERGEASQAGPVQRGEGKGASSPR